MQGRPKRMHTCVHTFQAVKLPKLPAGVDEAHEVVVDVVARARGIRLALLRLRGVHRADRLVGLERHAAVARVHFERALRKGSEWRLRRNFDVRVQQSMDARNCAACVPEVFGLPEKERLAYLLLGSRPFLPIPKNTQGVIARDGQRRLKVALQWAGMGEGGAYRSPPGKRRTMARMGCGTIPSMSLSRPYTSWNATDSGAPTALAPRCPVKKQVIQHQRFPHWVASAQSSKWNEGVHGSCLTG
jgi:hypothetical protein